MPDFTESQQSLVRLSRLMAWFSAAGFVLVPAVVIFVFLVPAHSAWLMMDFNHVTAAHMATVPFAYRLAALVCAMVTVAFSMWALWALRTLFLHYARGEVFSRGALNALNQVAVALFAGVVVGFVMQAPITFLLSYPAGPGHREISLGFGSGDVANLFMAGVVLVIARVMAEARKVADENESFV